MLKHVQDWRLYVTNSSGLRLRVLPIQHSPGCIQPRNSPAPQFPGPAQPCPMPALPPPPNLTAAHRKEGRGGGSRIPTALGPNSRRSQAALQVTNRDPAARGRQTASRPRRLPTGAATAADGSGLSWGRAATYSLSAMISPEEREQEHAQGQLKPPACAGRALSCGRTPRLGVQGGAGPRCGARDGP